VSLTQDLEWSPAIETGLSGEAYLSEHIEHHVDGGPSEAHRPGVYVLELSIPETGGLETYTRLWLQDHGTVPPYLESIVASNRLLYVGSAANVYKRIQQHLEHPNRSTTVAATFPIHHVEDVVFCESKEEADNREQGHAINLNNQMIDTHVHSR